MNRLGANFLILWIGQLVSLLGSQTSRFALGIWVFQRTGSVGGFALVILCQELPGILLSPWAGVVADRYHRRTIMLLSDAGAALGTACLLGLMMSGQLVVWHVYLAVALGSAAGAFQQPAYSAAISLLVPASQRGRASGMVELAFGATQVLTPVLAGALMSTAGMMAVLVADLVTFAFAVVTEWFVRIPATPASAGGQEGRATFWRELGFAWSYFSRHAGLATLLAFSGLLDFILGLIQVLIPPMLLKLGSPTALSVVMSTSGLGFVLGALMMSIWGGPARKARGMASFGMLFGLSLIAAGLHPSIAWMAGTGLLLLFFIPGINGCLGALWRMRVPPDLQGRAFAARQMMIGIVLTLAYVSGGPLADGLFEPLLVDGGALAGSIGQLIGVGPGRGIGLLFILLGLVALAASVLGRLSPRFRDIDDEQSDWMVGKEPVTAAPPPVT